MEAVLDPVVALKQLGTDLDELLASDLEPSTLGEARSLVELTASLAAKVTALEVGLQEAVQTSGVFTEHGHRSAQTFCAHVTRSSPTTARRTGRLAGALRRLPVVGERLMAGELGVDQAHRIASAMANPRARDGLAACDELIADQAATSRFEDFSGWLADLVRVADPDGTRDTNQRAHERRDARLVQNYDGTWALTGGWAALEGAELHSIFERFIDAEFQTDLDHARQHHGDDTSLDDLARTHAQRRADALMTMARTAAGSRPGANGSKIATTIVIDHDTFQRELTRLTDGEPTERVPGADDGYRCETLDGHRLDPPKPPQQHSSATYAGPCSPLTRSPSTSAAPNASSPAPHGSPPSSATTDVDGRDAPGPPPAATSTTTPNGTKAVEPTSTTPSPSAPPTTATNTAPARRYGSTERPASAADGGASA